MTDSAATDPILAMKVKEFYNHEIAQEHLLRWHPDISVDLMRQGGYFAYYAALHAQAEAQYDRLSNILKRVEARMDSVYRGKMMAAGEKMTEAAVKAKVSLDPRVIHLSELLVQAKEQVSVLKGTCQAFQQRNNAMIQLAFFAREEGKGSTSVLSNAAKENRYERLKASASKDAFMKLD